MHRQAKLVLLVLQLLCGAVAPACSCVLVKELEEQHQQAAGNLKDDGDPGWRGILGVSEGEWQRVREIEGE